MASTRARSWFLFFSSVIVALLLAFAGCATGDAEFDDDDDGAGASGAFGGGGGVSNPCGIDCGAIASPACHHGVCNTETMLCEIVPLDDGTECEDGQFCTYGDACIEGICVGGEQNTCGMTPEPCELITCIESTQSCTTGIAPDGQSCQPEDLCQIDATCANGLCVGGTERNCQYAPVPSACYTAECNPSTGDCDAHVDPAKQGTTCIDENDKCQVDGTCDNAGNCENTSPLDCSHLTDPSTCVIGVCNTSGACETQQQSNNDSCDDLDPCTINETCQSGVCTAGSTITSCGPADGCCPSGGTCGPATDADCPPFGTFCQWPIDVTSATMPYTETGTFDDDPNVTISCETDAATNAVWFSYTPPVGDWYRITLTNATTTAAWSRVAVYDGLGCVPLGTEVACEMYSSKSITVDVDMTTVQPYLILFHTDGPTYTMVNPTINIQVIPPPPPGQSCANPADVTSNNHSIDGSSHDCWDWLSDTGDTTSDYDFTCDSATGGDVVIEYTTGAAQTTLNYSAVGSDWDSSGYIAFEITESPCASGTAVPNTCQSSSGTTSHSGSVTVTPSTTYYIWSGDGFSSNYLPTLHVCLW